MPSVRVEPEQLSHLDEGQRAELVEVLDEFAACFSDEPGLCDVVTRRIVTTPEFVPKQMRPCLLYTSPSPRDGLLSRMPSSA